ncbi:phage tail-collar fiber domain-containing protein [Lysinibacillus capsici]|uniref:phage tail-collar fiber domain-containing protein n=1 Tax=Lysinibacillus capsici TaxID=2115968 RepID=UPI0028A781EB|nr:phage tail protein [Lysinibacillus capsici]
MAQYGTIITNIGLAQIANAQITQTKVGLEYIALGDGNGAHYVPKQNQTALVHEVWRGTIAELSIDPTNSNRIIIDAVIPVTAGGFTIREIGIFDDKNNLIAVGQYPEKYKPQLSEGVSEETLIHFVIETNNADVVKLTIDPTVIIASRNYVDGKVAQVQTALTEHSGQIATTEELGHIKPDGFSIEVDPVTGVASSHGIVQKYNTGHLNDLIKSGSYSSKGATVDRGFPRDVNDTHETLIEVFKTGEGWVLQRFTWWDNSSTNIYERGKYLNIWGSWYTLPSRLTSSLTSSSEIIAASANAVKQLNDSKANKAQENWITGTPAGSWRNANPEFPFQYRKDEFGIVHLRGVLTGGTAGNSCFQLPEGYRAQSGELIIPVIAISGATLRGITFMKIGTGGWTNLSTGFASDTFYYFDSTIKVIL